MPAGLSASRLFQPASFVPALLLVACLSVGGRSVRADEVLVRSGGDGGRVQLRRGQVLEYTGSQLIMRLEDGRQEEYDGARVIGVRPTMSEPQAAAERLREAGRFADALPLYRQARQADPRPWVRRLIMARETECYAASGQVRYAGETFLNLLRSDPQTPYFDSLPLAWQRGRADAETQQAAGEWLRQAEPAARLLGASWLLSSPNRSQALEMLGQLIAESDQRIARLAQAQRWRAEYVTASLDEVARWQARVDQLPASLRAGPYFVLGQGLARHQQHESAALAWLRIPILYPRHYELAADALWEAAGQLRQLGQAVEADGLLREIVARYPAAEVVSRARERLQASPAATDPGGNLPVGSPGASTPQGQSTNEQGPSANEQGRTSR